jgi:3-hydroxyacyl-CoA dehydrogenase
MKGGFNFTLGPFETWDAIGVAASVEKMEKDGFAVPAKVKQMLASGATDFYKTEGGKRYFWDFAGAAYKAVAASPSAIDLALLKADGRTVMSNASASLIDIGDGVFCLEFHTKMNALNAEIIESLHQAVAYVDQNGVGLVIGNQGGGMPGAFSAGADLVQVATAVKSGRVADVEKMIARLHQAVQVTKYCAFPVVAAPYGLALGGGCEVCLGADRIVAHAELYMGLVEIGVGLLPAGGGCMNLWKRFVTAVPEAVTDMDLAPFFLPVFMNIAMAKVSTSAAEARANGFLGPNDRIVFNRDLLIGEAKKEVLKMVEQGYAPPVKRPLKVFGESAQGMVHGELHNMQAGGFVSEYDVYLARRIAFVISGGQVRANSLIDEDVILTLERQAFVEFVQQEKTQARIEHMLKTGKPLRN